MKLYVGNLVWEATDEDVRELFEQYGQVEHVQVMLDRETGRSRGFAFVEMPDGSEAQKAIEALDEFDFRGRALRVNEAKPREDRGGRGGSGGGRGASGSGYSGRRGYGGGFGPRRGDY